ncbi:hypothetical protein [Spiroplasma endosymbiont of Virgichneumon dumeticola]|uniref:hypothetical protein n=1 Tax=Spiroplasma endosymbiont of Virgichneumon dumeticola TaxID=3139323 RepID=UPI0035C8F537
MNYKYFEVAEFLLTYCNIKINEKEAFDEDIKFGMTPIMATFALLSNKENTASDIIPYKRMIYKLCEYKDIIIDSPSYGSSALFYSEGMEDEKLTKLLHSKDAKKIKSLTENDIKSINNFKVAVVGAILGITAAVAIPL